jgi:hypothetical protein
MSDIGQTYHVLWASLLPQSNRQTGFSLRSLTRRSYVEFCRVCFCFRYRLEYDTPNALVEFALLRSDGEQIYDSLVCQQKQINEALVDRCFGCEKRIVQNTPGHILHLPGRLLALASVS